MLTSDLIARIADRRTRYRRGVARRLAALETKTTTVIDDDGVDMVQMHLAFLDYLSRESKYQCDYRVEFLTFYLQQRPDKGRMIEARNRYKQGGHVK